MKIPVHLPRWRRPSLIPLRSSSLRTSWMMFRSASMTPLMTTRRNHQNLMLKWFYKGIDPRSWLDSQCINVSPSESILRYTDGLPTEMMHDALPRLCGLNVWILYIKVRTKNARTMVSQYMILPLFLTKLDGKPPPHSEKHKIWRLKHWVIAFTQFFSHITIRAVGKGRSISC